MNNQFNNQIPNQQQGQVQQPQYLHPNYQFIQPPQKKKSKAIYFIVPMLIIIFTALGWIGGYYVGYNRNTSPVASKVAEVTGTDKVVKPLDGTYKYNYSQSIDGKSAKATMTIVIEGNEGTLVVEVDGNDSNNGDTVNVDGVGGNFTVDRENKEFKFEDGSVVSYKQVGNDLSVSYDNGTAGIFKRQ